ncbi:MAG: hypothetical protein HRT47_04960 [Candidatus Caenarcaniphilales bacterium]|nr:hypothetical protein [Candidatus Caenarcaniphilales bacterium]
MNKNVFLILTSLWLSQIPVLAFSLDDLLDKINNNIKTYPEVRDRKIHFKTGKSPLAALETIEDKTKREFEKAKQSQERIVTISAANKIVGLADGFINVKYQVQDGIKNALKDIFIGYPEYQRRKVTEEITNANINSHINLLDFIYQFSFEDYFTSLYLQKNSIAHTQIYKKLKQISFSLVIVITLIKLLESFFIKENIARERIEVIIKKSILCLLLLITLDLTWSLILKSCLFLSEYLNTINTFIENKLNYINLIQSLISSWESLLNRIGYFPALILSLVDTCSHFLFYSVIAFSSLILVLIKLCSPLLILTELFSNSKSLNLNYFFLFIKIIFLFMLFPLFIKINHFIANSIDISGLKYLNIIYSINLFLAISIIFLWTLTYRAKTN